MSIYIYIYIYIEDWLRQTFECLQQYLHKTCMILVEKQRNPMWFINNFTVCIYAREIAKLATQYACDLHDIAAAIIFTEFLPNN